MPTFLTKESGYLPEGSLGPRYLREDRPLLPPEGLQEMEMRELLPPSEFEVVPLPWAPKVDPWAVACLESV